MNGSRIYAGLFKTGQYGRLYITAGIHARGTTFRIQVLPAGVKAIPNGENNTCLNKDAVEVYGAIGGQLGWTESYGWIHKGKWVDDFEKLVDEKRKEIEISNKKMEEAISKRNKEKKEVEISLLEAY